MSVMTGSIVIAVLLAATRRLPLAAILAIPAVGTIIEAWRDSRVFFPEPLMVLGGIAACAVTLGILVAWVGMRLGYRIPERLVEAEDLGERGATSHLKALAELGRIGFRPAGRLAVPAGMERQVREYFTDPTGTITAWITRHQFGFEGLSFCSEQDGARLKTTSWPFLHPWPVPPGWTLYYHHFCPDPAELLRRHREHLASLAMDAPDPCRDVPDRERLRHLEEMEHLVRIGRMVRDGRGRFRLTFRGFLATLPRAFLTDFRRKSCRIGW